MRSSSPKIILLLTGALAGLLAVGLVVTGGVLALTHALLRDDDGFYRTPVERFRSDGVAIVADIDELADLPARAEDREVGGWNLATEARLRARSTDGSLTFVGIAPTADLTAYFAGAEWDQVRDVRYRPFRVLATHHDGTAAVEPPAAQPFWLTSATGTGRVELRWTPEPGDWSAVVMRADGSDGVTADVSAGLQANLFPLAAGLLLAGLLAGLAAVGLLVTALRSGTRPPPSDAAAPLDNQPRELVNA